jgi:hypothetical protein
MELIDGVLYTLLLVAWLCWAYIASISHFEIFALLGVAVSGIAILWLGIKSISQITTKKKTKKINQSNGGCDREFSKESTLYKCVACGHIEPYKISECPKCGGITTKQVPYRVIFGDEKEE